MANEVSNKVRACLFVDVAGGDWQGDGIESVESEAPGSLLVTLSRSYDPNQTLFLATIHGATDGVANYEIVDPVAGTVRLQTLNDGGQGSSVDSVTLVVRTGNPEASQRLVL